MPQAKIHRDTHWYFVVIGLVIHKHVVLNPSGTNTIDNGVDSVPWRRDCMNGLSIVSFGVGVPTMWIIRHFHTVESVLFPRCVWYKGDGDLILLDTPSQLQGALHDSRTDSPSRFRAGTHYTRVGMSGLVLPHPAAAPSLEAISRSSLYTEATNRKSSTVRSSYDSFTPTHHRTVSQLAHQLLHYPPLNRQYSRTPPAL